jgi:hypothetical protein
MKKQSLAEVAASTAVHTKERELERKVSRAEESAKSWKSKYEHACRAIEDYEHRFESMEAIDHDIPEIQMKRLKGSGESTAILACSDWHIGEVVDPSTVNSLNSFNVDIGRKRAIAMFQRSAMMIDVARGLSGVKEMVVWLGGDFISGALHDDQKENDEISPTESIIVCEDLIVNGLRFLKKEAKMSRIVVVTSGGNHGRTTPKPRASTAHSTSFEQLMYWHLASTVKDPGISFKVENSYHNLLPIYDRLYRFHHGDCVKYLGGSGGLGIPLAKAVGDWDKTIPAYHDVCGHFHTTSFARKFSVNGSIVGYNSYAMRNKCAFEEPSQNLLITSRKRGNTLGMRVFAD